MVVHHQEEVVAVVKEVDRREEVEEEVIRGLLDGITLDIYRFVCKYSFCT